MANEDAVQAARRAASRKFLYDVGVNVLSNLVAAAAIYLAAVGAGYLRVNPVLLAIAVALSARIYIYHPHASCPMCLAAATFRVSRRSSAMTSPADSERYAR